MWIQIYDLPTRLMTEVVGKQLGNFFGELFETFDTSYESSSAHDEIAPTSTTVVPARQSIR